MATVVANPAPRLAADGMAALRSMAAGAVRAGREPVSPASAAAFRVIFGLLGVAAVVRFAANGWIADLYVDPAHHLGYYGFGWVQAWPGWGMYAHFALLGLAALGVALGYRWRLSVAAFFLLFTYVELIDQTTYLNHYYLVSLLSFTMVFLPLACAWSLDARRRPADAPPAVPRAVLWALRAQVGLVYVFAGVAKLNPDWLFRAEPLRIWLYNIADTPLIGPFAREAWLPYAMSWAGVAFDLAVVPLLLWRRTRPFAFAVLVAFHVATAVLFPSIGLFPWIMMGAALVFFEPDWPVRLLRRARALAGRAAPDAPAPRHAEGTPPLSWRATAAVVIVAAVLVAQAVVPLRHLAYPGNVRWTEEGYRFSWRVLVTEKTGLVKYRVAAPAFPGERLVYPEEFLTPTQAERMAYQPSLILATAHIIRDDFTARGHDNVEVRADAYAAFNGRRAVRLIDPAVDLAEVEAGLGPRPWILGPPP